MGKSRKNHALRPFSLGRIVCLGFVCLLAAEAIACYIFAPDLFYDLAENAYTKASVAVAQGSARLNTLATDVRTSMAQLAERLEPKQTVSEQPPSDTLTAAASGDVSKQQDNTIIRHEGYYVNPATGDTVLTGGNTELFFYNQTAPAWKDQLYGTDPIGTHACGPTAMAMVISSLTNYRVDPKMMSDWSVKNGYYATGGGSYHALIPAAARAYGLTVTSCSDRTVAGLKKQLAAGNLLVVLMRPGHFTKTGHFMIVRGIDANGNFLIADPQSFDNSVKAWDPALIVRELAPRDGDGGPVWAMQSPI